MTPESQRIAIAEACGWRNVSLSDSDYQWDYSKKPPEPYQVKRFLVGDDPNSKWRQRPPDYLNDLNAMHEAEKVLDVNQRSVYRRKLAALGDDACFATAAQRCQEFLRTLNLWTE